RRSSRGFVQIKNRPDSISKPVRSYYLKNLGLVIVNSSLKYYLRDRYKNMIMPKLRFPIVLGILLLISFSSCISGKKITYFQDMENLQQEASASKNSLQIKPNDLLTISVAAENLESVQPFNLPVIGMGGANDILRAS